MELKEFCVKRIKVRASIPPSVSGKTIRSVLKKAGVKWRHTHKKGILSSQSPKSKVDESYRRTFG